MIVVARNIVTIIQKIMASWKAVLTPGGQEFGEVQIKRGIIQGNSLFPKVYHTIINSVFNPAKDQGRPIIHLLFMNDLKLYATFINTVTI